MTPFLLLFAILFLFRYLRLVVNLPAYWRLKPIRLPWLPTVTPDDVTVIISTTCDSLDELLVCLRSIIANAPTRILLVTSDAKKEALRQWCEANFTYGVEIKAVTRLNKRRQMIEGLRHVTTKIVTFADDDVIWPPRYLQYVLAAFEDYTVGAAGSRQRVARSSNPTLWHFLGTAYLERRNFNTGATMNVDGSLSTLSGRTCLFRTSILQNSDFVEMFLSDTWFGKLLNSDDDKCMTRWVFSKGWNIRLQTSEHAILQTHLAEGNKFLSQCVR